MWKTVLAASTAIAITGATLVYAQQGPGQGGSPESGRWRPSAEDISAFGDARIAALKAGLRLTAEQEKHWPALENALKAMAKQRGERFAAFASGDRPSDPIERMRRRADMMSQTGASLKSIADAAAPLYASLDDAQKQRFMRLARLGGRGEGGFRHGHHESGGRHHGMGMGSGMMGHDMMGRGMMDRRPGDGPGPDHGRQHQ